VDIAKKLVIRGFVQGVGFRYAMCAQAESAGVSGYVMNREDGSVEAVVQGQESQVEAMLAWAKKGPSGARVEGIEISEAAATFNDFSIRYF
jgi:acylphosphatase